MKQLLFTARGRLNRAAFWKGVILVLVATAICGAVFAVLMPMVSTPTDDGGRHFETGGLIVTGLLSIGFFVFSVWSGLCLGIKRYHDRGKSGLWILIQFAPIIGPFWYLIETGFLAGTPGPNSYGPDPLATSRLSGPAAASV